MIRSSMRVALIGGVALAGLIMPTARAGTIVPLSNNITNNANPYIGGQLSVEVNDLGSGVVQFLARNATGGITSAIQTLVFDGMAGLYTAATVVEGPGTNFVIDLSYNLPGGNSITPQFDSDIAINRDGNAADGINPGEYAGVNFTLTGGATFNSLLVAIENGALRLGVHVQSIGTASGSDSYINGPPIVPPAVPEPSTMISGAIGAGLLGLAALRRRRASV